MKISLSMIVKNEERFLRGCLDSVKNLVDEIIVVDTGSTDSTKAIAAESGAKIYDFPWCNDFSAARNESLSHTTGDWILYLDADERIDSAYHHRIRTLVDSGKADAYLFNLKSKIGNKEDAQYHLVAYPRLFRKQKRIFFSGNVHEQITPALNSVRARIVQTEIVIEHLGYAQADEVIRQKAQRNYQLLLEQVERRENYGYALYQLGQTEIVLGEIENGLAHLRESLKAGGFGKSVEASIHGIIAENSFKLGDLDGALAACDKSLASAHNQTFAFYLKGEIFMRKGKFRDAVKAYSDSLYRYDAIISKGKVAAAVEPVFDVEILYFKLGRAASSAGDIELAKRYFGKAIDGNANPSRVAAYLEFLLTQKLYDDAAKAAAKFPGMEREDWFLRLMSAVMIELGDHRRAVEYLEKVSNHDKVSMSSLASSKMKLGDYHGAEGAYRSATELGLDDPQSMEFYGLVQFKLGKFSEAVGTLNRLLRLDPANQRAKKFIQAAQAQLGATAVR